MKTNYEINLSTYLSRDFPSKGSCDEKELLNDFGYERFLNGYKLNHSKFSRTFRKYVTMVMMRNGELAVYNHSLGIYETDCEEILHKLIKHCMNIARDLWNPADASIALRAIRHDTLHVVNSFNNDEIIVLEDGVLDLSDYRLYPHSPKYLSTVQLPFGYGSAAATPIFDAYLDDITCGDEELKAVLQEMTGYCLCNSTSAEKAFFLVGNGCNGKSVYARLLQSLVGESNYSTTSLSALNGTFGLASLMNANVNISAENNGERLNAEIFKSIVSGDVVEVNRKYKDAISVRLHTKIVMLFNELPDSNDLTYGFFRKIMIIPFNMSISREKIDVNLPEKLKEELPGIFRWAIGGLKRLREQEYVFSACKACDQALEAYKTSLNPAAPFFEACFDLIPDKSVRKSEIYRTYLRYCAENSYDPLQCQRFWKALKSYLTIKALHSAARK